MTQVYFDLLPQELKIHIASMLDYKDLSSCCQVSQDLREICMSDKLWKPFCVKIWDYDGESQTATSMQEYFKEMYLNKGRYISIYKKVSNIWTRIKEHFHAINPAILPTLKPGLSDTEMDTCETHLGVSIPLDVRCLLTFYNGQAPCYYDLAGKKHDAWFFGRLRSYDYENNFTFAGLKLLPHNNKWFMLLSGKIGGHSILCYLGEVKENLHETSQNTPNHHHSTHIIPTHNTPNHHHSTHIIPTHNTPNHHHSTHIIPTHNSTNNHNSTIHPATLSRLKPGNVIAIDSSRDPCYFMHAKTALDFFSDFVCQLDEHRMPIHDGMLYRFWGDPKVQQTTRGVHIRVYTSYLFELSSRECHVFAYLVEFKMDTDASEEDTCKLETRMWEVESEKGGKNRFEGEGVIGEYPVFKAGTHYTYISCTNIFDSSACMRGHYTVRNLSSNSRYRLQIPEFYMEIPDLKDDL